MNKLIKLLISQEAEVQEVLNKKKEFESLQNKHRLKQITDI